MPRNYFHCQWLFSPAYGKYRTAERTEEIITVGLSMNDKERMDVIDRVYKEVKSIIIW
jgi:hypothetical protein